MPVTSLALDTQISDNVYILVMATPTYHHVSPQNV